MRLIQRLHRKRKAFTLIELIMAIVVAGILAIPLSLMIGGHIESVFYSQDLTLSDDLARFDMEVINNMNYANIISAVFPNYQGYAYDVSRKVTYAQGRANSPESLKKIIVEVRKHGSTTPLLSLITYIAKNVLYGA